MAGILGGQGGPPSFHFTESGPRTFRDAFPEELPIPRLPLPIEALVFKGHPLGSIPQRFFDLPEIVPDVTVGRGFEDAFRRMIFRNMNRPRPSKEETKGITMEQIIAEFLAEDMRNPRKF